MESEHPGRALRLAPTTTVLLAGALAIASCAMLARGLMLRLAGQDRCMTATHLVDVNLASSAELALLPEVGPALASRIEEARAKLGGFASLDDLRRVKGIGPATLRQIEPHITLSRR